MEKWRNYGDGPGGRISEDRHNKFGSSCQVYWGGIWQSLAHKHMLSGRSLRLPCAVFRVLLMRSSKLKKKLKQISLLLNLERVREVGTRGACALNTPKALQRRAPADICLVHSLRRKV